MYYIYSSWCFRQHATQSILEIRGSCEEEDTEAILLGEAVRMVKRAEKFEGIPYATVSNIRIRSKKEKVVVQFSLIFPNDRGLERFIGTEIK